MVGKWLLWNYPVAKCLARSGVFWLGKQIYAPSMMPNSRPVCSPEAFFSAAHLCGQVAVRDAGSCCGKVTLAQISEEARMLVQGPPLSLLGPPRAVNVKGNSFPKQAPSR